MKGELTPDELRERWEVLAQRAPESAHKKFTRYGMLYTTANQEREETGVRMRCLACQGGFEDNQSARRHNCPNEDEFRLVTGRYPPNRRPHRDEKTRPASTPEEWVRWSAGLLAEIDRLKQEKEVLETQLAQLIDTQTRSR